MIVGVDVSSRRIDLAWLENGKPQRWHQELAEGHLIDRLRSIRVQWPRCDGKTRHVSAHEHSSAVSFSFSHDPAAAWETTEIAIEYPFGRGNAIAALMATVGVITRQAPPWARVAWPSSGELRAAIGAKNNKQDAHEHLWPWFDVDPTDATPEYLTAWSEHSLDALVACVGWTRILEAQE